MAKTLVLGSGISALTYLYHNKDAKALAGEMVGGMFKKHATLGPQYIWADDFSKEFVRMLGLPDTTRKVYVGVWHSGKLYTPDAKPTAAMEKVISEAYAQKTRGTKAKSSFMSSGKMLYDVLTTSAEAVTTALLEEVKDRLIPSKAMEIDMENRFVHDTLGDHYTYDRLVSTIPAPAFLGMAGLFGLEMLKGVDKTYGYAPVDKCEPWVRSAYGKNVNYVYCPDKSEPWHRVTFQTICKKPYAVFEFTNLKGTEFEDRAFKGFFECVVKQPLGQIVSGKEVLKDIPNVKFLGRYAQWDHSVKFNDVLRRVVFEN